MFDGVTIWTRQKGLAAYLLNCSELKFTQHYKMDTPDLKTYTADYCGLVFSVHPSGLVRIRGSLHKFYNENLHNYDDFTFTKLSDTIIHLTDSFNIDPTLATIHTLEFGFNIILPYSPNNFLDSILSYKGKCFNSKHDDGYKECELYQILLKFYNKGLLYRQPANILRVELKISKMAAYKGGTLVLNDLLKRSAWETSVNQLFKAYDLVIMNDLVDRALLSNSQRKAYDFGINPQSWNRKRIAPCIRYKRKQQFNKVIKEYGQYQYHQLGYELMKEKYTELLQG